MDVIYLMQKEMLRRNLSPRTITTYTECIKHFFKKCRKEPRKITKKDIKEYIDYLIEKRKSGSTINVHLNSIKFLMEEILSKRLFYKIKYSKTPKSLPTFLTKQEVFDLLNYIENKKHKLMITLMYSAGLRVSELINLKVQDMDFNSSIGWVRKGKGRKDRLFIIAEKLKEDLAIYITNENLEDNTFLFSGRKDKP